LASRERWQGVAQRRVSQAGRAGGGSATAGPASSPCTQRLCPGRGEGECPSPEETAPLEKFKAPEDLPNKISSNSVEVNLVKKPTPFPSCWEKDFCTISFELVSHTPGDNTGEGKKKK